MQALPSAVSLSRALLSLSRAKLTGELCVCSGNQSARMAVVDGLVRAVRLEGTHTEALGDRLARSGEMCLTAHRRALGAGEPSGPVGEWLVSRGIATRPAVEQALRNQLREGTLAMFRWLELEYRFVEGSAHVGVPWLAQPVHSADLVLDAMRRAVEDIPISSVDRAIGECDLQLTSLGMAVLDHAQLHDDELAMVQLLRGGTNRREITHLTRRSTQAKRTLCALAWLGAVRKGDAAYGLLLRKRRQVRRRASAPVLLDIPQDATASQARKALRRLARELHPDRIGRGEGRALTATSTEVMGALIRAESEMRARSAS